MSDKSLLDIARRLVETLDAIKAGGFQNEDLIQEAKTLNMRLKSVYDRLYGATPLIVTEHPTWIWWRRAYERASQALAAIEGGLVTGDLVVIENTKRTSLANRQAHSDAFDSDQHDFDVALTFAGEDRAYVGEVAAILRSRGVLVFYDEFVRAQMWGTDLYDFFDLVFQKQARFAVMFVSENYVGKEWPNHERKCAQARALVQSSPYILPVRLDDSELPGLRPTVAYEDGRLNSPSELAEVIIEKLSGELPFIVPRMPSQSVQLANAQPPHWEFRLFAGYLAQGKQALESKWRDHELRLREVGERLDPQEAFAFVSDYSDRSVAICENFNNLMLPDVQKRAFGRPGEPGDADRIEHLARRLVGVYEAFLDWARDVRSVRPPAEFVEVFDAFSTFVDDPIKEARSFFDRFADSVTGAVERHRDPDAEPEVIEMEVVLRIPEEVLGRYYEALADLRAAFGFDD